MEEPGEVGGSWWTVCMRRPGWKMGLVSDVTNDGNGYREALQGWGKSKRKVLL